MEKVMISKEQEIRLLALEKVEGYNMVLFLHDNNADINFNAPFSKFSENELSLIWMGHYEIKKDNTEVLQEEIEYSLNNHDMSGYAVGYRDGLKFAKKILEGQE